MPTNIQEQIERRHDGSLFFQAQVVAVVQMDGSPGVSTAIAALDQRRTVERAQAGEQGQRQARPFAETQRPAVLDGFENRGRTFDDGDLVVHR